MRDGHRREYGPRKQDKRLSFSERSERTLADVGIYRSVSFRDLAEAHFGGHPYTARRSVNLWIRAGALREHAAKGPKGNPYKVFTLTRAGAQLARRLTTSITGAAVLLGGSRLRYLAPFWRVILDDYGLYIAVHLGVALVTVAAILYGAARAVGLADLGRRVNRVERSIRRGEGDRELVEALHRDAEGTWD